MRTSCICVMPADFGDVATLNPIEAVVRHPRDFEHQRRRLHASDL